MAIELGLGVFTGEWHPGTGLDHGATLRESIAQVRYAEQVGLDSVWVSEHHFHEAQFVGSLAAYCGAMVQATERITVGYGLALAPLHDPIRMAEDAAFLDQLSDGRFVLGLGLGYREVEYAGFETTRSARVGRTEELIAICRQAWTGEPLAHEGRHFTRTGLVVSPQPATPGGPPIMLGGHHPRAVDRAARLADRFCMDAGTDSEAYEAGDGRNRGLVGRVETMLARYRDALARHGRDVEAPAFSLNVGGFLHPDGPDAAWEAIEEAYLMTRRVYGDWYGLDPSEYAHWRPGMLDADELAQRRSELLLGSVDDVLPVLEEVADIVGENLHVMFRSKYPLVDDALTRASIDQLGEVRRRLIGEPA
ncbi:LLM class flavin-dependent oxidoreductase [Homoserinibacter sp. GY 40078]|uniref:LLM class flavin-dependent oxidoreductase n=1 Tax=Homoserinibacter sp. GY 40078 TaxID=2603275 RepID=UPI0011C81CF3|nr:LLM class flavin-dependent oxidoreductase [Homoserinibacter sp. GY 40078]TXK19850.1 LLM class flavin-dependent oxidoreductase [Homoserinibacter sp. GY 40078]